MYFYNYADVTKWYTPRDPARGKQMSSYLRMFREDGIPIIYFATPRHKGEALCRIHPDDTVEFIVPEAVLRARIMTVGSSLHKFLRFTFLRVAKGRYNCVSLASPREEYEYFPGLKFNMVTGACLNPLLLEENSEGKKLWFACLRLFKNNVRTRAKIGALDAFCASLPVPFREKPLWESPMWREKLYYCIRNNTVDNDILRGFAASAPYAYWARERLDGQKIVSAMNTVCEEQSRAMRRMFGALRERQS